MHSSQLTIAVSALLLAGTVVFAQAPATGSVERLDPALDKLIAPDAKIEKVAGGFKFLEGPMWHRSGVLWFSDLVGNVLYQTTSDGKVSEVLNPGGYDGHELPEGGYIGSNGMALGPNNTVTIGQHGNRRIISLAPDKTITVLVDRFDGKRVNSPNDVLYGPGGSLYFTDPPYGLPKGNTDPAKELPFNGVYRFANGKVERIAPEVTAPNGIALSPDYKILYLTNSEGARRQWMRYDVAADGSVSNGRVFVDVGATTERGTTDGMKVDSAGNIYATGPGGIWVMSPDGKHLGTIKPPEGPSSCAWGDDDRKTLYITARTGLYKIRVNVAGEKPFYN